MKHLKDILNQDNIQEGLKLGSSKINIKNRVPQNKAEEACKELADICKETLFKDINLKEEAFKDVNNDPNKFLITNPKYFNKDSAEEFFGERSGILKAAIHCTQSGNFYEIELSGLKGLDSDPFVSVSLNDDGSIANIVMSKYIKEWLI